MAFGFVLGGGGGYVVMCRAFCFIFQKGGGGGRAHRPSLGTIGSHKL